MEIKNEVILNYVRKDKKKNNYIIILYKNYATLNKLFGENIRSKVKTLRALEDEIYKVKDKVISENKRIQLELDLIKNKIQNSEGVYDSLYDTFIELDNFANEIDFSNFEEVTNLKKKISVLQAKMNIRSSFLYASYLAFEDSYRNIYINHIKQNEDTEQVESRRFK